MTRTTIFALIVVTVMLLLAGGAVLAKDVTCTGGECLGTKRADTIAGTTGNDQIRAGAGGDDIDGNGGSDVIRGGLGNDTIDVSGADSQRDTIFGGEGDDVIGVEDNNSADKVDCGPGKDTVVLEKGVDTVTNCETKVSNPPRGD
jgi:Ca2+-binding RTX toxin-like protein